MLRGERSHVEPLLTSKTILHSDSRLASRGVSYLNMCDMNFVVELVMACHDVEYSVSSQNCFTVTTRRCSLYFVMMQLI